MHESTKIEDQKDLAPPSTTFSNVVNEKGISSNVVVGCHSHMNNILKKDLLCHNLLGISLERLTLMVMKFNCSLSNEDTAC